jgi:outer membrane protein insertion porin family
MRSLATVFERALVRGAVVAALSATSLATPVLSLVPAYAEVVTTVVVDGNVRVDAETVRTYVTVKPGRQFGPADVDESIRALYATGLFADVQIARSGSSLVVTVKENPVINRISFEGNRRISDETLTGTIESKPRAVLTRSRVQSDVQRILDAYRNSGRFRASVDPKIIELPQNRVDLVFEINEGDKTGVSRITFIGNKSFSDGRLRDVIRTRESGLLSFLRTTDSYDPDRLAADQELLRRFYYNHGFADFRIISAVADLDRERNIFFITFTVEEGAEYKFGDISVDTTLSALDPEKLRSVVTTSPGATYSATDVEKSLEALTIEASRLGYAFAQVRPRGDRDYENHTISIVYTVDEGPRVYIERIEVRGNTRTRDYVIRREFDVVEGDAYNRILMDRAERRLNNLGFFKTVRITSEPGSAPDRVVVLVDVEEQSTGEVSFGIGYSTSDGVIGDVSVTEKNFLGRGQFVRAMIGGGENQQVGEFSFTEPYFLGRRIAAGFDLYAREYERNSYRPYDQSEYGGGIRFAFPITEALTFKVFNNIEQRDLTLAKRWRNHTSIAILQDEGERLTSIIGYELTYNTLDNLIDPRAGFFGTFTQEYAGVGGDVSYLRNKLAGRYYRELLPDWGLVGMVKAEGGYIAGIGERVEVPDQFYIGGETIRGFQNEGIGPRDVHDQVKNRNKRYSDALGGRAYVAGTVEGVFPLPMVPSELGFSGAVFSDAGTLWDTDKSPRWYTKKDGTAQPRRVRLRGTNNADIRWSAGFGLGWKSPFGPIRADFAWPIMSNKYDKEQVFRLGGGTRF